MEKQTLDILNLLENNKEDKAKTNQFTIDFHNQVKKTKKVDSVTFLRIKKMINTKEFDEFVANNSFTKYESVVIGRALMKSKIKDKQKIINMFVQNENVVVLQCLLCTKIKVDVTSVVCLVKTKLKNKNCELLRLLLVLWRNYKEFVDKELLEFCKNDKHGICVEIYDEYVKSKNKI